MALKFLGVVHHNRKHAYNESTNLYFLISCCSICKNAIFFVTTTTTTQGEESTLIFTESEYLINQLNKFQVKQITVFWDKMWQRVFFTLITVAIEHSSMGNGFWKDQNFKRLFYSSYYIKICCIIYSIVEFW